MHDTNLQKDIINVGGKEVKVQQEAQKEESSLKPESLTDLPVADAKAEETKAGSGTNIETDTFSWGVVNPGRLGR